MFITLILPARSGPPSTHDRDRDRDKSSSGGSSGACGIYLQSRGARDARARG